MTFQLTAVLQPVWRNQHRFIAIPWNEHRFVAILHDILYGFLDVRGDVGGIVATIYHLWRAAEVSSRLYDGIRGSRVSSRRSSCASVSVSRTLRYLATVSLHHQQQHDDCQFVCTTIHSGMYICHYWYWLRQIYRCHYHTSKFIIVTLQL